MDHCNDCDCARNVNKLPQILPMKEDSVAARTILALYSKVCAPYPLLISWRRRLRSNSTVLCPIHSPSFHPSSRDSIIESIAPSALPIRSNRQTYGPRTEFQYTTNLVSILIEGWVSSRNLASNFSPTLCRVGRGYVRYVSYKMNCHFLSFYRYVSAAVIASPFRKDRRGNQGRVKRRRKEMEE